MAAERPFLFLLLLTCAASAVDLDQEFDAEHAANFQRWVRSSRKRLSNSPLSRSGLFQFSSQ